MMRLHSLLFNQHRPGTSDKNIAGKQIIKPLPDKTWKGKWCVLADGVCSPPHWCPYLPTARVESLRALSLWNPPSVYLCHALRVLGITSSFVPFPEFPFSPASKEFSPHTHTQMQLESIFPCSESRYSPFCPSTVHTKANICSVAASFDRFRRPLGLMVGLIRPLEDTVVRPVKVVTREEPRETIRELIDAL